MFYSNDNPSVTTSSGQPPLHKGALDQLQTLPPCVKGGGFCGAKDEGIVKLNDNVDRYLKNLISQSPVTVDRHRQRKANLCLSKIQRTVTLFDVLPSFVLSP